jgi:hypothetical protein
MKYVIPLFLLFTSSSYAETAACGDASKVYNILFKEYGERPFAEFVDRNNTNLIMFANPNTNTWTVIQITDNGLMCAIDSGEKFRPADEKKLDDQYKDKGPPT